MEYLQFDNCDVEHEERPAHRFGAIDLLLLLMLSAMLFAIVVQLAKTESPLPKPETALIEQWCKP